MLFVIVFYRLRLAVGHEMLRQAQHDGFMGVSSVGLGAWVHGAARSLGKLGMTE